MTEKVVPVPRNPPLRPLPKVVEEIRRGMQAPLSGLEVPKIPNALEELVIT